MGDFAPELKTLLQEAGCYRVRRGKGDHEIWFSPATERNFVVDSKILSRHTANGVLKQAGLRKHFQVAATRARRFGSPTSASTASAGTRPRSSPRSRLCTG
jgi:predicted RNA binding protein YcfA (HicA-like mRNA interferase family)